MKQAKHVADGALAGDDNAGVVPTVPKPTGVQFRKMSYIERDQQAPSAVAHSS